MRRLWQNNTYLRILVAIFLFAWVVLLLPTINILGGPAKDPLSSPEKNFFISSKPVSNRMEISFFCKAKDDDSDWNLDDPFFANPRQTLSFHVHATPASVESSLAAACAMKPPLRLFDNNRGKSNRDQKRKNITRYLISPWLCSVLCD